MPRTSREQYERALLCAIPGCTNQWFSAWNGAKRCQKHAEPPTTKQVPTTPPAKPWSEPKQREE